MVIMFRVKQTKKNIKETSVYIKNAAVTHTAVTNANIK